MGSPQKTTENMLDETPYPRVTPVDSQGNIIGGNSSGSDTTAANQTTQIGIEEQIRDGVANLAERLPPT
ncbi:MAG: hypothetical protein HWQ38_08200, partial [Nostoc sp. NMS7]|uniref:hypothetical protein n=1 Tax=Nostoc sp. NMS7 TaxID=2815391 RepID=UPI0025FC56AB